MSVPSLETLLANSLDTGSSPRHNIMRITEEAQSPRIVLDESNAVKDDWVSPNPLQLAIAVDPVALVTTECITVTSAMRKHARWAQSSVSAILGGTSYRNGTAGLTSPKSSQPPSRRQSGRLSMTDISVSTEEDTIGSRWGLRGKKGKSLQDNPLMSAFSRLRSDIRDYKGLLSYL